MIRWLLHKMTRQFEARYQYNCAYMNEVYNISTGAAISLSMLPMLSQYRGPDIDIWAGAAAFAVATAG